MTTARSHHTATLQGKVAALSGASTGIGRHMAGTMHIAREQYEMVLLASGSVLVTGGFVDLEGAADAELIDPARGAFEEAGSLAPHQYGFTTTLLHDGRALIAGGQSGTG